MQVLLNVFIGSEKRIGTKASFDFFINDTPQIRVSTDEHGIALVHQSKYPTLSIFAVLKLVMASDKYLNDSTTSATISQYSNLVSI